MTAKRSVLALAIALVAALFALPAPALAADGQIQVSVPTKVPCYVSASGMVTAPSNWEIRNTGSEETALGNVSVDSKDSSATISADSSVGGGDKTAWFSYEDGALTQEKSGDQLAAGASVLVDWSVGNLGHEALEGAANGGFNLAHVTFSFAQKRAFAVLFDDGTAKLYKRAVDLPAVGSTFDGGTVAKVVDGIENKESIFNKESSLTSVSVADSGIRPKTTKSWFNYCQNLTLADLSNIDFSVDTSMAYMFNECHSLATLDVSKWDTSSVT